MVWESIHWMSTLKKSLTFFVRVGYVCFENCTQWPLFLTVELIYSDFEYSAGIENVMYSTVIAQKSETVLIAQLNTTVAVSPQLAMTVPMFQQCIFYVNGD